MSVLYYLMYQLKIDLPCQTVDLMSRVESSYVALLNHPSYIWCDSWRQNKAYICDIVFPSQKWVPSWEPWSRFLHEILLSSSRKLFSSLISFCIKALILFCSKQSFIKSSLSVWKHCASSLLLYLEVFLQLLCVIFLPLGGLLIFMSTKLNHDADISWSKPSLLYSTRWTSILLCPTRQIIHCPKRRTLEWLLLPLISFLFLRYCPLRGSSRDLTSCSYLMFKKITPGASRQYAYLHSIPWYTGIVVLHDSEPVFIAPLVTLDPLSFATVNLFS